MNVAFIGTGTMGQVLIRAFIRARAVKPEAISVHNRTRQKAEQIAEDFPGITVMDNNRDLVKTAETIFICVKPLEYPEVLKEIQPIVLPSQLIVSITSPVMIEQLESILPCKIVKMIPSITNAALAGSCLFMPGSRLTDEDKTHLLHLFSHISQPVELKEEHTRVASDLACCGPAFISYILQDFAESAVKKSGMPRKQAIELATSMLYGTAQLLSIDRMSLEQLQEKVAVPGGITKEGLDLLARETEGLFNRLLDMTHEKYFEDVERVRKLLQMKNQ